MTMVPGCGVGGEGLVTARLKGALASSVCQCKHAVSDQTMEFFNILYIFFKGNSIFSSLQGRERFVFFSSELCYVLPHNLVAIHSDDLIVH